MEYVFAQLIQVNLRNNPCLVRKHIPGHLDIMVSNIYYSYSLLFFISYLLFFFTRAHFANNITGMVS